MAISLSRYNLNYISKKCLDVRKRVSLEMSNGIQSHAQGLGFKDWG
jgi:hypothetical protein